MTHTATLSSDDLNTANSNGRQPTASVQQTASVATLQLDSRANTVRHRSWYWVAALAIIVLGQFAVSRLAWVEQYPSNWVLPLKDWIDSFFEWLVYGVRFFGGTSFEFTPREVTRGVSGLLAYPLGFSESLFFDGFSKQVPALPWVTVVGLAALLGHWLGGWRSALLGDRKSVV